MKNSKHVCLVCSKKLEYSKDFFHFNRGYVTQPCKNCKKLLRRKNNNLCNRCGVVITNKAKFCCSCAKKIKPTRYWLGKKLYPHMVDALRKSGKRLLGKKMPKEFGDAISERQKGSNSHFWKGGITPIHKSIRVCKNMVLWRKSVFERDNYTCIMCGKFGGKLQVDHIFPFSVLLKKNKINSLEEALLNNNLWDINNGRTLCIECHKKTDTYGWKALHPAKHKKITKKRFYIRCEKLSTALTCN